MIPYLYLISYIMYTSARVAKPGQRRQVQGLISQEFLGSNPIPRIGIFLMIFVILTNLNGVTNIHGFFDITWK